MKTKLLKKIRKEYHIAITAKIFFKAKGSYIDHYKYEYSYASKKGLRSDICCSFDDFMLEFLGYHQCEELFKARKTSRQKRIRDKKLRAFHEGTLNKIKNITK